MNDQEAGGRIMAQAFHNELQVISQEGDLEKGAGMMGAAYKAVKGLGKGIGSAAKGGMSSAKRSYKASAKGKRGMISRMAKATGTGAKSFGKKLSKGQAAALAGGAGAAGTYAAT